MSFVLALDQGTTSSRAIVFDREGSIRAVAQQELTQFYPRPGWVEHDATEIWATQSGVIAEALAKAGIGGADIAALGITNQRETTVVWERASGKPVAPAIVWLWRTRSRASRISAVENSSPAFSIGVAIAVFRKSLITMMKMLERFRSAIISLRFIFLAPRLRSRQRARTRS